MKKSEAISKFKKGEIQIQNDLNEISTINTFIKSVFPKSKGIRESGWYYLYMYGSDWEATNILHSNLPIVKLSEITEDESIEERIDKLERCVNDLQIGQMQGFIKKVSSEPDFSKVEGKNPESDEPHISKEEASVLPNPDFVQKPPIGLKPKYIHNEHRFAKVNNAIVRYLDAGLHIPVEWVEEYNELNPNKKPEFKL